MSHKCNRKCKSDKLVKRLKQLIKSLTPASSWKGSIYTNMGDVDRVEVATSAVFLDTSIGATTQALTTYTLLKFSRAAD